MGSRNSRGANDADWLWIAWPVRSRVREARITGAALARAHARQPPGLAAHLSASPCAEAGRQPEQANTPTPSSSPSWEVAAEAACGQLRSCSYDERSGLQCLVRLNPHPHKGLGDTGTDRTRQCARLLLMNECEVGTSPTGHTERVRRVLRTQGCHGARNRVGLGGEI